MLGSRRKRALAHGAMASLVLVCTARAASAQVVNPADVQKPPPDAAHAGTQEGAQAQDEQQPEEEPSPSYERLRSWELPATIIVGEPLSTLREEDRIGAYAQPRWTARRLFPTTRIYVRPEGSFGFEFWTRVKEPREGETTVETQYEVEFGLPGRFQLDLYAVSEKTGSEGPLDTSEQKYELRYALADWNEIWGNPTLYFEWVSRSEESDKYEAKLLFGGEVTEGWHWGTNLVFEHEISGARENEYSLTAGVSRTVIDEKLALGAEVKSALVDTTEDRGEYSEELEIGPSMRWYPVPAMHVDVAPLIGIGGESRHADLFFVLGWEF